MDEQQIRLKGQTIDPVAVPSPRRRAKPMHPLLRWGLIAVVFAAISALIYQLAKGEPSLTTEMQQQLYPLLSGLFIGGLTVLWLFHQTASDGRPKAEPKVWFFPALGGALTLIVAVLAYMCVGMWPVGEKSAMIIDMRYQYAPMFGRLRDMLLHGGSPLYAFQIGTGTSFIPLFGYYLASPLNVLIVLFPLKYLAEGILTITLIKITLIGASMTLCLQYVFKRRCYATVVAGMMYALTMYVLAYSWNVMWLDCVMSLPLCVMGFERLMRTGKYLLYVLTLAFTLIANYYIGFMVCIFLALYYLVYFFREERTGRQRAAGFGRFALGSLLGGGLAMIVLVPIALSLSSTSAAGGSLPGFETNFAVFDLIGRGLFQSSPTIRSGDLPNLYCGVLAVLALPIFATMKSIPLRRRLSYLGLLGALALSLVLKQVDLLWHGMHSPNDLPYRYSFLYCFVLVLIAYEVLCRIQDIRPAQLGLTVAGIALYLIVEEKFGTEKFSSVSLYVSFALIAIYAMIMLAAANRKIALRCGYMLMLVFVSTELLFNASASLQTVDGNEHYTDHEVFLDNEETDAVIEAVERMREIGDAAEGGAFYRMEFLPRITLVDTGLFNYRGITVFASSGSYNMTRFMGSLGYDVNGVNSQIYRSFMPTSDALLGIKYVALKNDLTNHPQLVKLDTVENDSTAYHIYENPYALPVGLVAKNDVKEWEHSYYNPVLTQNSLYQALTGNADEILQCQQIATDHSSATVSSEHAFNISGAQTVTFNAVVSERGQVYIQVDCRAAESIAVSGGGNKWSVNPKRPYIIDAGTLDAGTEVTVTVTTSGSCSGNVYVARLNADAFVQDTEALIANGMVVTSFTDTSISGTVHADEASVLCTTVPYDAGWTVKVDGRKVETFAVGSALLAVDLEPGDHEIVMSFFPRGFIAGIAISAASLACLVLLLVFQKKRGADVGRAHA